MTTVRSTTAVVALLLGLALSPSAPVLGQCPASGSCLEPHDTPGCASTSCCETVCVFGPQCCEVAWDIDCVLLANELCPGVCGSGSSGDCFVPNGTPGCNDAACCDAVCNQDPFCCEKNWDSTCSIIAGFVCESGEMFECGDAAAGDCFVAHLGSACSDGPCCTAVCQLDASCCSGNWDTICVALANSLCLAACEVPCPNGAVIESEDCGIRTNDVCLFPVANAVAQAIPCPSVVCGTLRDVGSVPPDVDVYEFSVDDPDGDGLVRIEVQFASEFVGYAAVFPAGCANFDTAPLLATSLKCVPGNAEACLPPGTWWVLVASGTYPDAGGEGVGCIESNHYLLELNCDQACGPVCGIEGDCFLPHGGTGCADVDCCELVCAQDAFCCEGKWDIDCAVEAFALCEGTPPANDDCGGCIAVGTGSFPFSTIGATTSGPALPAACDEGSGNQFGADIWYCYAATCDGFAVVSTCGTADFDTRLAGYTGSCDALSLVGCSDDAPGCVPSFTSRMNLEVVCGETYLIRLGGFANAQGTGTLTIMCIGGACPVPCPADLDANDMVDGADLGILLGAWGTKGPGDLDGNGTVDGADLGLLLGAWGECG
ncbi:MAG: hypothetical protein KDA22_03075 [Phycisphaerales bacterium]|nr:hypothetical protein [Phycisphaerales bacterium]